MKKYLHNYFELGVLVLYLDWYLSGVNMVFGLSILQLKILR